MGQGVTSLGWAVALSSGLTLPRQIWDFIISNRLFLHLHRPEVLRQVIKYYSVSGIKLHVVDIYRPGSKTEAVSMEILQLDFFKIPPAPFTLDEVEDQLVLAVLFSLAIKRISGRTC